MLSNYDNWKTTDFQYEADERKKLVLEGEAKINVTDHIEWLKQDYAEDEVLYMDEDDNVYNKEEFISWSVIECNLTEEEAYQGLENWEVDWEAYTERLIEEYIDANW